MALKDYFIHRETVALPHGQSFEVGPLTLVSVLVIIQGEGRFQKIKTLFDEAMSAGLDKDPNMGVVAQWMAKMGPDILADLIAAASGEEGVTELARQLPIGVQMDALNKIVNLTFEAEGGVKKFGESVVELLAQLNGAMSEVTDTQSKVSSKGFIGSAQS